MDEHLIDTNVLSKIFYGNSDVKNFVESFTIGIETIVYIECIQGSISNSDKDLIKQSLQNLRFYPLNNKIAQKAIQLIDLYSNSRFVPGRFYNCRYCFRIRFNINNIQR